MRDRDVDSDEGLCSLRRHEQRLERRKKTTSDRLGPLGLALTTHRTRNRCAPGDGQRLPEVCRRWCATATSLGTATAGKTGQGGDHWVWRRVERCWLEKSPSDAFVLRAIPGGYRARPESWPWDLCFRNRLALLRPAACSRKSLLSMRKASSGSLSGPGR